MTRFDSDRITRLDDALRVAFTPRNTTAEPSGADGDTIRRREPSSYEVLGELGRGGMGVVLRGRDRELGRDVALKVLQPRLRDSREAVDRFIAEAQIAGQLQHPGIVPVYELGLMAGDQPFFAMKLIDGQTLRELLDAEREELSANRRLLTVFEQVCQTVAFAHARAVIHRDLKPANILVGRFGEVQVVDWGLAKVVGAEPKPGAAADEPPPSPQTRRSETGDASLRGAVMGTPAYMPPEQAQGQVEELDARADVFALGAILCELLTGAPPYRGPSDQALDSAATARLADARERLAACATDRDLVDLALACLAAEPAQRPASAVDVAARVQSYLAGVDERARRAEIEAAEERVKAAQERRAKRLAMALGASVVLSVAGGSAAYFKVQSDRAAQRTRTVQEVDDVLARASALRQAERFEEAQSVARSASAVLASGRPDAQLEARVNDFLAAVASEAAGQRDAEERRRRNDELRRELDLLQAVVTQDRALADFTSSDVQLGRIGAAGTDREALLEAIVNAFGSAGVDLRAPTDEAASALRATGIASELGAQLEHALLTLPKGDGSASERAREKALLAVVYAADEDPWRRELRTAMWEGDDSRVAAMAEAGDVDALTPLSSAILGQALHNAGRGGLGEALLRRALERHPGSFELNLAIAGVIENGAEALRYSTAARALQPRSARAVTALVASFESLDDLASAAQAAREAVALNPDLAKAQDNLGIMLLRSGDVAGATAAFERAIELDPSAAPPYSGLGNLLLARGDVEGAIEVFEQALKLDPSLPYVHSNLGVSYGMTGGFEQAENSLREACRLAPDNSIFHYNLGLAHMMQSEWEDASDALELALDKATGEYLDPWHMQGQAERRGPASVGLTKADAAGYLAEVLVPQGRLVEALEAHADAVRGRPSLLDDPEDHTPTVTLAREADDQEAGEDALAFLDELSREFPRALVLRDGLAQLYADSRDEDLREPEEALRIARELVEAEPGNADFRATLGLAHYRAGNHAAAIAALEAALEARPKRQLQARLALALARHHDGRARPTDGELEALLARAREAEEAAPELRHLRAEAEAQLAGD
ncbi:MAG: tetratricopeptide repeat protein [Planctomycetota bacterium]